MAEYAKMRIATIDSEALFGYTQITTFFEDFSVADNFGVGAIKDTYKRAFREWKTDYKYLTELYMVLNWKIWQHHEEGNTKYVEVYDELWRKTGEYAVNTLKGDELTYFYRTTD